MTGHCFQLIVIALALAISPTYASQKLTLFPASSPAKCLDGSPAGFYFEAAQPAQATKWVVWIQEGGACLSEADCTSKKTKSLGTSKVWPTTRSGEEHQSTSSKINPDFFGWNHVYMKYCSGDIWMGRQTHAVNPWSNQTDNKFFFSGHTILGATIDAMKATYGMDTATDILFTGCSAGGIGNFANADWLSDQFPAAKVRSNPMAGWFGVPMNNYEYWVNNTTDPDPIHMVPTAWLNTPDGGDAYVAPAIYRCMEANPHVGLTACSTVPMYYEFTKTPMFVSENTADAYQVFIQGGCPEIGIHTEHYIEYMRQQLAGSLQNKVINGLKNATDGLFAPACIAHCLQWSGFGAPKIQGKTPQQAVGDWYFGRGTNHQLIDVSSASMCDIL